MALSKLTYVDNVTVIPAANLNAIQDEVIANGTAIQTEVSQRAYQDLQLETNKADKSDTYTKTEVDEIIAEVEDGAVKEDGTYDNLTAGSSEALLSDNYTLDTEPYVYRKGVGARAYVDSIVGGSVGWNQLIQNGNFASTNGWGVSNATGFSVSNNVGTFTVTEAYGQIYRSNIPIIKDHKYFVSVTAELNAGTRLVMVGTAATGYKYKNVSTSWVEATSVLNASSTNLASGFAIAVTDGVNGDVVKVQNAYFTDLTLALGSTIADYVYSLETATSGSGVAWLKEHFPKMFGQYNAYDAGSIKSVESVSEHKMVGKNLWSGDSSRTRAGETFYVGTSATLAASEAIRIPKGDAIVSWNWSGEVPADFDLRFFYANGTYTSVGGTINATGAYNRPFTITNDCVGWILYINKGGTISNIQVELGSTATAYEPYETWSYPLDFSLTLRGIPKLNNGSLYFDGDTYASDGTVTRKYGIVDLGTLTYNKGGDDHTFYCGVSGIKSDTFNIIASGYEKIPSANWEFYTTYGDKKTAVSSNYVYFSNANYTTAAQFKTAMSGTYLVYELATPTTETADPYQHLQIVGSTEEYVTTSIVSVGNNTKYLEDLKAKIEGLPWDLSMIAPIENGTTASKAYAVGEYFLHNNQFCKAKTSIASGATFTLNTNYTVTTIGAELKSLA